MTLVWSPGYAPVDPDYDNVSLLLYGNGTNGSTNITDNSPSPKTVTVVGNAQISTAIADPFGSSTGVLAFDGTGDYLQIQDPSFALGSNSFTLEFWVYFPSGSYNYFTTGKSPIYIGGTDGGVFSPFSIRGNGTIISYISGSSTWSIATGASFSTLSTNVWRHWAISRSGSAWYTFENGVLKNSWTNSQSIPNPTGQGSIMYVARTTTDGTQEVQCYMKDLRLTVGVARYTSNFTPPTESFPDLSPTGRLAL